MKKLILLLFISFIGYGQENIERYKVYETSNMFTSLLLDTATGRIWQLQIGLGDVVQKKSILSDKKLAITIEEAKEKHNIRLMEWEKKYNSKPDSIVSPETKNLFKPSNFEFLIEADYYEIQKNGRFQLYPTNNDFNFIMVDVTNGESYQVQWSNKKEKDYRFVVRF